MIPTANPLAKIMPMAVSILRLARRLMNVIANEAGNAQANAPQKTLPPKMYAIAIPDSDEWATASPMNAIPLNTTNTPTTEHTRAANIAANNACRMKMNSHGPIKASIMFVVRMINLRGSIGVSMVL